MGLCRVIHGRARTSRREDPVQRGGRVPLARLAAVSLASCQDQGADALAKLSACAVHHRPHISAHSHYPVSHLSGGAQTNSRWEGAVAVLVRLETGCWHWRRGSQQANLRKKATKAFLLLRDPRSQAVSNIARSLRLFQWRRRLNDLLCRSRLPADVTAIHLTGWRGML